MGGCSPGELDVLPFDAINALLAVYFAFSPHFSSFF
jgi:hypothetical protein